MTVPKRYQRFPLLRARPRLHAYTVCYWASLRSNLEDGFHVAGLVRPL